MSLRVFYPHGGKHFLMHWWTYNDRGHIILAKSEAAILPVATKIFQEHPDAEIKDYLEVDLVAPSALMEKQAQEFLLKEEIYTLNYLVAHRMKEIVQAGKKLPPMFEVCQEYQPEDPALTDDDDGWYKQTHYECQNCEDTIRLVGITKEALYHQYHKAWDQLFPHAPYVNQKLVVSRATPAKDNEELYVAQTNFGHHSTGIDLMLVAKVEKVEEAFQPGYIGNSLFFYRKLRELDSSSFQEQLKKANQALKDTEEKNEQKNKTQREQDELARMEAVMALFSNKE